MVTASDEDAFDPVLELHRQLRATEERPVKRAAGWRLGEAQALASDIAEGHRAGTLDSAVIHRRAGEIRDLLADIDGTGDATADDHVAAARELATRIAARTSSES